MSEGVYRALLIGNSTFPDDPHNLFELKGPVNDLALLREALVDPTYGLFAEENVRLVPERTKREITRAIEEFYRSAGFDDTLLLYYSGHGKSDEIDQLFLCARDTTTDLLVSTGISDVEIDGMMTRSSARSFVVILDCCHSGAFKAGGLPMNLKGTGRFLLTSSRRGEPSRDADRPHETSAFTRHLVAALRAGADRDGDGYISVSEVYEHALEALRLDTKQIPQRQFDKTVGDIALARAAAKFVPPGRAQTSVAKPVLAVTPLEIKLRDIGADEELPVEIVDVYNDGEGELDWTATSSVDWIEVTTFDAYCELRLRPRPGVNRGNVHFKDAGRGGSRTVRVLVEVRLRTDAPSIDVTPPELDFGVVARNSESPARTLLIKKTDEAIEATASSDASWITVEQQGDVVSVSIDTTTVRELSAHVVVRSSAGDRVVPVRAVVEQGPVLRVDPATIDFGRTTQGKAAQATITVTNGGSGELRWRHRKKGDFFTTKRAGGTVSVTLAARSGSHVGSIAIQSNAGSAAVDVRARVAPKRTQSKPRETASASSKAAPKPKTTGAAAKPKATTTKRPQPDASVAPARRVKPRKSRSKQASAKRQPATSAASRSIKQLISELGPAPPTVAVQYALDLLAALPIHRRGGQHGRITSHSVRVDAQGVVAVDPGWFTPLTDRAQRFDFAGLHYRAPEQVSRGPVDPRSDLYSVGVVLYELLTGRLPFDAFSLIPGGQKPSAFPVEAPSKRRPGLPAALDKVVLRALEADPRKRYQDAQQMSSALLQAQIDLRPERVTRKSESRYPRRPRAALERPVAGAFQPTAATALVASRELGEDETLVWAGLAASVDAPGSFAVLPAAERVTLTRPNVIVTNKRLLLAPSTRTLLSKRVSIPWSKITGVECVDESRETGVIFKKTEERACVYLHLDVTALWGKPSALFTPSGLSYWKAAIVTDTLAEARTIRDRIAARTNL